MNGSKWGLAFACLLTTGVLGGCIFQPIESRDVPKSTTLSRVELEMVSDARLVREDTSPDPQGRFGFKRGENALLVITRITSSAKRPGRPNEGREDRYVERVWITVPIGVPLGAQLDLKELEQQFYIGYDRNNQGRGYFIRPCSTSGKLTVLERSDERAVIRIDAEISPWQDQWWRLRDDALELTVTEDGIYAQMVHEVDRFHPDPLLYSVAPLEVDLPPIDSAAGDLRTPLPGAIGPRAVGAGRPSDGANRPRPIVGKWSTQMQNWKHRYQFNPNGTFILASTRGVRPMVLEGLYEVNDEFVIMEYKKFYEMYPGGHRADHMKSIANQITAVQVKWMGDNLVLSGKLAHTQTEPPYIFSPASFADLRSVLRAPAEVSGVQTE